MAAVRGVDTVTSADIALVWEDKIQLERCLNSLLVDGLVEAEGSGKAKTFRLPR